MTLVVMQGKTYNQLGIGPTRSFDYATIGEAVAAITGGSPPAGTASSSNRYLLDLAIGVTTETALVELPSWVSVRGRGAGSVVMRSGGSDCLRVGDGTTLAEGVELSDFTLHATTGQALEIGATGQASSVEWNDVALSRIYVEGVTALAINGIAGGVSAAPPELVIQECRFLSNAARCVLLDGCSSVWSLGNSYELDRDGGIYLSADTTLRNRKVVELKGPLDSAGAPVDGSFWSFEGDVLRASASDYLAGIIAQRHIGIFVSFDNTARRVCPLRISSVRATIEYGDADGAHAGATGLIVARRNNQAAEDDVVVEGSSLDIHQLSTAPGTEDLTGIYLDSSHASGWFVKAFDFRVFIRDDVAASGSNLYAIQTAAANNTIEHDNVFGYYDQGGTRGNLASDSTGGGTITKVSPVT